MSYDPSHRMPPRQERWPAATPAEGWPSYQTGAQQAMATAAYPAVANGYGGYAGTADYFDGRDDYRRDDYRRDGYGGRYGGRLRQEQRRLRRAPGRLRLGLRR